MYQFIVNPSAGAGRGYRIWKRLEHQLEMDSREIPGLFYGTQGDAAEIAKVLTAERDDAKVIVIVGGEGTYNEVLEWRILPGTPDIRICTGGFSECAVEGI